MFNNEEEFLGVDKNSGFALRVIILSVPAGLIFLILGLLDILPPFLATYSYISILFFNTVFLIPISAELQKIKKYIINMSANGEQSYLPNDFSEKETKDLSNAINSMHKFWSEKNDILKTRTLSDAAVLDTLPDPLFMVNSDQTIIGANLAARDLFSSNLNGDDITTHITNSDFADTLKKIILEKKSHEELNICLHDLPEKPKYFLRITPLSLPNLENKIIVISLYDLSKALLFEQMQQDFVANASHELRTPLSIISGFIETLQTTAKDDPKASENFLNIMQEQTVYMSNLIENLLSISKIELSVNIPPQDTVNIIPILTEIKNALSLKLKKKGLTINLNTEEIPEIIADKRQIMQIIQNLMDNAVKYSTPKHTIEINISNVETIPQNQYYKVSNQKAIKISIANHGINILPEQLSRITERFYRLQDHKNQNIKGTGLGLSIAVQIIKRHRGNLVITSENHITTFNIYLPITQEAITLQ